MSDNVLPFRRPEGAPGEIADVEGSIWLPGRRKVAHGQISVTWGQASVAEMFGWTVVEGSELAGRVIIHRSPAEGHADDR